MLNPFGFAVEVMDVDFLAASLTSLLPATSVVLPLPWVRAGRSVLQGPSRSRRLRAEPARADPGFRPGKKDCARLDELPVERKGVVEPPGLNHALQRTQFGFQRLLGPLSTGPTLAACETATEARK